jgi:hypothetical protein
MWRRRLLRQKWNMWVHPVSIKKQEFRILSHLYMNLLEDEEKVYGVFRMNIQWF